MTTVKQIYRRVTKWRKNGELQKSYSWIADALGVSKPEAKRLENPDHIPGVKVQKQLGVSLICPACKRKKPAPRVRVVRLPCHSWLAMWKSIDSYFE